MFNFEVYEVINIIGLLIGIIFGAVAQKNQFCFSGSIKDYILIKSTKRASSVLMAMIVAVISTKLISVYFELDLTQSVYYKENINYFIIIFGGILFGIGMMLADGCSNRNLIKFAQGNSNSLITLIFIAIFAYATTKGLVQGFLSPFINSPLLLEYSAYIGNIEINFYLLVGILIIILIYLLKKIKRIFSLIDGFIIGLLIAASWYVTGVIGEDSLERIIDLTGITFVYPTAQTLELFSYYQVTELSFPISVICGVILGAFTMTFLNKKYSFGCTADQNINRTKYNMIGGALMGTGGVLSIGCTVGQGLTGLSSLAFASVVAVISILISATITAIILNKYNKLPMCFIFEWKDSTPNYQI